MTALLALTLAFAATSPYDTVFQDSLNAYDEGDYAHSVALLEQLVDEGVVEDDVFYNLGNAYFRLGQYGEAIANYERVLQLNPRHRDAERNLEKALSECPRGLARPLPPEWERGLLFWHGGFRQETSGALAVTLWLGGWTLLALRQFKSIRFLMGAAIVSILAGALFGASWYAKANPQPTAVVISEKAPVRYGTNTDDKVRFELFEGDRVLIEASEGDWVRVATIGRERGWTQVGHLVSVGPPYAGFDSAPGDTGE